MEREGKLGYHFLPPTRSRQRVFIDKYAKHESREEREKMKQRRARSRGKDGEEERCSK